MNPDLEIRIKRIYAALDVVIQNDVAKAVSVSRTEHQVKFSFDGGMSQAELQNAVMTSLGLVAHLPEHLKRWLREQGKPTQPVDELLKTSEDLKIIKDLCDREKHGGDPRDGGLSKRSPRITSLHRGLQMGGNSNFTQVVLSLNPASNPVTHVAGSPQVLIDGNVVDSNGAKIGDLARILESAFAAIEALFATLGISAPDA